MTKIILISLQYEKFPDAKLNGCFNDAENFKNTISKIENLNDDNFLWMRDDLNSSNPLFPNRNNILNQIRKTILERHKKIYIHFSGHGYSITDYNNDEINLKNNIDNNELFRLNSLNEDSCIVTNEGSYLNILTDDEIFKYLSINNFNQNIYAFFDCCHAGTIFDLAYVTAIKYNNNFPEFSDFNSSIEYSKDNCTCLKSYYPNKVDKVKGNIFLISGCRDKQYSYESQIDSKVSGHFTTQLCKILNSPNINNYSLEDVFYLVTFLINDKNQIPVYSSNKDTLMSEIKPWEPVTTLTTYNHNLKWWLLRYYRSS